MRAYQGDANRFRAFVAKPLRVVTVADVQNFSDSHAHLADASRARSLSAIESLFTESLTANPRVREQYRL